MKASEHIAEARIHLLRLRAELNKVFSDNCPLEVDEIIWELGAYIESFKDTERVLRGLEQDVDSLRPLMCERTR